MTLLWPLCLCAVAAAQPRPCLVAFEVAVPLPGFPENTDVRVQLVAPDGSLPWGSAGVAVAATGAYERRPCAATDGAGGAIVVFEYKHSSGPQQGQVDLCAQRVDREGLAVWNSGQPVAVASTPYREHSAVVASDGAGGVIVAYLADVPAEDEQVRTGVCAQRIDAEGRRRWLEGARAVVLQEADCRCADLAIAASADGGACVAYRRVRAAATGAAGGRIVLQRLSDSGRLTWHGAHPNGLTVSGELDAPRCPVPVSATDGRVWVVFQAGTAEAAGVYSQAVGADGVGAEPDAPLRLSGNLQGQVTAVRAVADGVGGLLCTFGLVSVGAPAKLYCTRADAEGRLPWTGPVPLLNAPGRSYRELAALGEPQGAMTIAFTSPVNRQQDADQHRALAAQRVGRDGSPLWGASPLEVTNPRDGSALAPSLASDGLGGVYLIYVVKAKAGDLSGDSGVLAVRLSSAGKRLWRAPVPVAGSDRTERAPVVVPT